MKPTLFLLTPSIYMINSTENFIHVEKKRKCKKHHKDSLKLKMPIFDWIFSKNFTLIILLHFSKKWIIREISRRFSHIYCAQIYVYLQIAWGDVKNDRNESYFLLLSNSSSSISLFIYFVYNTLTERLAQTQLNSDCCSENVRTLRSVGGWWSLASVYSERRRNKYRNTWAFIRGRCRCGCEHG